MWALYIAVFAPSVIAGAVAAWGVVVNRATARLLRATQAREETGRNVRAALELACSTNDGQQAAGMDLLEALESGGKLDDEQRALIATALTRKLAPAIEALAGLPEPERPKILRRRRLRLVEVEPSG